VYHSDWLFIYLLPRLCCFEYGSCARFLYLCGAGSLSPSEVSLILPTATDQGDLRCWLAAAGGPVMLRPPLL